MITPRRVVLRIVLPRLGVFSRRLALLAPVCAGLAAASAPARGADAALLDAARREGEVTWYTSQIIDQLVRPLAVRFEALTGVKVNYVRTDSAGGALRILNEGRSGHMLADVFDGAVAPALVKEGMVMSYIPESAKRLPASFTDPKGFWLATNLYIYTLGINTDLVPKDRVPKTFADLLDPQWKGKMAWSGRASTSSAAGFIGTVLAAMGDEKGRAYLQKLAGQQIAPQTVSARQIVDQVMAGEYAIAIQILNNHAAISAAQGAPVTWQPLDLSLQVPSVMSATKAAPHPNAARLLLDFMMSPEGQQVYRDNDYIPVDPAVAPKDPTLRPDGVKVRVLDLQPDDIERGLPVWQKTFQDIFR